MMKNHWLTTCMMMIAVAVCLTCNTMALSFYGTNSAMDVNYEIDFPPGYSTNTDYAVIYFLHGINQSAESAKENGVYKEYLDAATTNGLIEPCILVYADGDIDSFYADSYDFDRPIETSIMYDLIPYIDTNYPTKGSAGRALMGFSMGGNGALKTFAKFPDDFVCVVSLDGAFLTWSEMTDRHPAVVLDMFNNDETNYTPYSVWYNTALNADVLNNRIRQVAGQLTNYNENMHAHLDSLYVDHEYEATTYINEYDEEVPCIHTPRCVFDHEERNSFEFIGERLANHAPTFATDPFTKTDATAGEYYNQFIGGQVTDSDSDPVGFSKVSGPDWLTIYSPGGIKGTPGTGDIGTNTWIVKVEDDKGGFDTATMIIVVQPSTNWTPLTYDNFESGMGNWTDGGSDVFLSGDYAIDSQCVDLQDDSGDASSIWLTSALDLSSYSYLQIECTYMPISMDTVNEDFWVLFSDNGGSSWTTIKAFTKNTDFINDVREYPVLILDNVNYKFTSNVKIRFQCDASGDADDIYLDDIRISAQ